MTTPGADIAPLRRPTNQTRTWAVAYWIATAISAWELAGGAVWDVQRVPHVYQMVVEDLGYPEYFLVIIGLWKALGAVALLIPRFPRLKEWAYAGGFFVYSGAVVSHLVVGDTVDVWAGPAIYGSILMASWALRPASRRDLGQG